MPLSPTNISLLAELPASHRRLEQNYADPPGTRGTHARTRAYTHTQTHTHRVDDERVEIHAPTVLKQCQQTMKGTDDRHVFVKERKSRKLHA